MNSVSDSERSLLRKSVRDVLASRWPIDRERLGQAALDILGTGGLLSDGCESAPLGEMEQILRHSIMGMIGGGTNEIQRDVIA